MISTTSNVTVDRPAEEMRFGLESRFSRAPILSTFASNMESGCYGLIHDQDTDTVCPEPGDTSIPNDAGKLTSTTPTLIGITYSGFVVALAVAPS